MGSEFFLFYTEANIVCILLFGLLLLNDYISMNKQVKQIVFGRALIAHILYFISDIFWAGVLSGTLPRTRFSVVTLNFTNFVLLSAIAYEWALFAALSVRLSFLSSKRRRFLFRLPFAVMAVSMLIAYLIAPYYWVSAAGELNALYYPLMLAAPLTYVTFSCVQSLRQAGRAEDPAERKLFRMIGLYPLAVVFFGVVQLAFIQAPLFCFGCTVMMLFFYIRSMNDLISLDPLTKLSNRRQLLRCAAQERTHRRDGVKSFVVMADANDFKSINDSYGHSEGDRALVLIAEALKSCAKAMRYPSFLSRIGGDEFALIVHAEQAAEVERLLGEIRRSLAQAAAAEQTPYQLSVSVGFEEWTPERESFQDCLRRADEKLYAEKRKRKQQEQNAAE